MRQTDIMVDLADFLTARWDESEAAARACEHADGPSSLEWRPGGYRHLTFASLRTENYSSVFAGDWDRILIARDDVKGGPLAAHIARHDPARVLREVEAGRKIIAEYEEMNSTAQALAERGENNSHHVAAAHALHNVLRALAAVHSDHPDYPRVWVIRQPRS